MASTELQPGAGLRIPNPTPVDAWFCKPQVGEEPAQPYASTTEACQLVPGVVRYNGLRVNVNSVIYRWYADLSDAGLLPETTASDGGPGTAYPVLIRRYEVTAQDIVNGVFTKQLEDGYTSALDVLLQREDQDAAGSLIHDTVGTGEPLSWTVDGAGVLRIPGLAVGNIIHVRPIGQLGAAGDGSNYNDSEVRGLIAGHEERIDELESDIVDAENELVEHDTRLDSLETNSFQLLRAGQRLEFPHPGQNNQVVVNLFNNEPFYWRPDLNNGNGEWQSLSVDFVTVKAPDLVTGATNIVNKSVRESLILLANQDAKQVLPRIALLGSGAPTPYVSLEEATTVPAGGTLVLNALELTYNTVIPFGQRSIVGNLTRLRALAGGQLVFQIGTKHLDLSIVGRAGESLPTILHGTTHIGGTLSGDAEVNNTVTLAAGHVATLSAITKPANSIDVQIIVEVGASLTYESLQEGIEIIDKNEQQGGTITENTTDFYHPSVEAQAFYGFTVGTIKQALDRIGAVGGGGTAPTTPGQVATPTAAAGNEQVTLTWAPPAANGAEITSYTVRYRPTGAISYSVFGTTANTFTTVTGLSNGVAYQFTVAATNSAGTGAASNPTTATPMAAGQGQWANAEIISNVPGQSNEQTFSPFADVAPADIVIDERVGIWRAATGQVEVRQPGVNDQGIPAGIVPGYGRGLGLGQFFINEWLADPANEGKKLLFFLSEQEGAISTNGAGTGEWNRSLKQASFADWAAFKAWMQTNGNGTPVVKYAFVGPAEQDADENNTDFLAQYTALMNEFKGQGFFNADTRFTVPMLQRNAASFPNDAMINTARTQWAAAQPFGQTLSIPGPAYYDDTHFTTAAHKQREIIWYANKLADGGASNPTPQSPTITSFAPLAGQPGDVVTVSGTNFTQSILSAKLDTQSVLVTYVNANTFTFVVPAVAQQQYRVVRVTTAGGTANSGIGFVSAPKVLHGPLDFTHAHAAWQEDAALPWELYTPAAPDPNTVAGRSVHYTQGVGRLRRLLVEFSQPSRLLVAGPRDTELGVTQIDIVEVAGANLAIYPTYDQAGPQTVPSLDSPVYTSQVLPAGVYLFTFSKFGNDTKVVSHDLFAVRAV